MPRRIPIEKRVADRVRALREEQGLSQAAFARIAQTSRSQVAAVERGDRAPTIATLETFARALGVPLAQLVGDDHPPAATTEADRAQRLAAWLRSRGPRFVAAAEAILRQVDGLATDSGRR